MKKIITTFSVFTISCFLSTAFIVKDSNGKAGYTSSPGEQNCSACHGGGSSATSGVTVSATPSFTNDEYIPGTVYNVTLTVAASGFTRFGFGCEVLNTSNTNIGTLQSAGTGVKFVNAFNSRRNATHTSAQTGSSGQYAFTFQWVAPAVGQGDAIFYYCGNAVNGNGNTSGDLPIPGSYTVNEGTPTVTTSISNIKAEPVSTVRVFPNPTSDYVSVAFALKTNTQVLAELIDVSGKRIKTLVNENQAAGNFEKTISLDGIDAGVYFVKVSGNGAKLSQTMLLVK